MSNSFTVDNDDKVLLLKVLSNIINNPDSIKFKSIDFQALLDRFKDKKCIEILQKAGFKKSIEERGLRLTFDNDQYSELEYVYSQLMFIHIFNENSFVSYNPHMLDAFNSKYLLKPTRLHVNEYNCYNLRKCPSLCSISQILLFYDSYIDGLSEEKNDISIFESVYSNIRSNYNDTNLLNDYHHLITVHRNQFEEIYNQLTQTVYDSKPCNLLKCLSMMRNQRDRANHKNKMNELYQNADDITSQQLLDRIHCHLFHTFDVGYKLTENERDTIVNDEDDEKYSNTMNEQLHDNTVRNVGRIINGKKKLYQNNTEFTRLNGKHNVDTPAIAPYSYGFRYYYWDFYKNNPLSNDGGFTGARSTLAEFYVENVFENLQQEALFNECSIPKSEWIVLVEEARKHILTSMAKNMHCCRRGRQATRYNMVFQQPITEQHLIALMLYCNFDALQHVFSETYRKLDDNESIESLKERHAMFYFLGKLLTESCECFGMETPVTADKFTVYHGTNKYFTFSSMNAHIKGPFSTTLEYAVALNFCASQGMILEIEIENIKWNMPEHSKHLMCFDMQWLSNFANEAEIFCIGGRSPFRFNNITEASGINNKLYVLGLRRMLNGATSGEFKPSFRTWKLDSDANCKHEIQMAFRLLANEFSRYYPDNDDAIEFKNCADYIKDLVHINCRRVKSMLFFETETKVHDRYLKYESGWVNLERVTTIFPNIDAVQYFGCNKDMEYWKELSIFECVLEFIINTKEQSVKLKKIEVMINENLEVEMRNYIQFYRKDFENCGWTLFVQAQYDHSTQFYQQNMRDFSKLDRQNKEHKAIIEEYEISMQKLQRLGMHIPDLQKGKIRKNVGIVFQKKYV